MTSENTTVRIDNYNQIEESFKALNDVFHLKLRKLFQGRNQQHNQGIVRILGRRCATSLNWLCNAQIVTDSDFTDSIRGDYKFPTIDSECSCVWSHREMY